MNTTRRGIFGLSIGAAAAAPAMAKAAAAEAMSVQTPSGANVGYKYGMLKEAAQPNRDWIAQELASLRERETQLLNGQTSSSTENRLYGVDENVMALRSLSQVAKSRIAEEKRQERIRQHELLGVRARIASILKDMTGL